MGVVLMGVIWVWLAMIWAWTGGVASVLELVLKKLEPMYMVSIIYPSSASMLLFFSHNSYGTTSYTMAIQVRKMFIILSQVSHLHSQVVKIIMQNFPGTGHHEFPPSIALSAMFRILE